MAPPSGTVTFLFTDIEGSTRRWEADPDAMRDALTVHDRELRAAIEAHGGWLFKHTGDGACAAFASAGAAIAAAVEAQHGLRLPVRIGIATGEAQERDGDYFGPVLNRTARVMAAGHGGQILVAASTAALLSGVELVDLGEHRLRDLAGPARIFQVVADGLPASFESLRTLDVVPGNLPVQASGLVGREAEVRELVALVRANRLVTLTGVGGVGKTRLALQVAAELAGELADGAWFVELAPVGEPASVPVATAAALGVLPQAGIEVTEGLVQALSGRRLLVVVDNCEHVLGSAGDLVEAVLARTSTVHVMATSREGLGLGAEHLWPVPSLGVEGGPQPAAVELFVERARAVRPSFTLADERDRVAVTEICRRLDGLALAIELAAARLVSLSPKELLERLEDRFRLLAGTRRAAERHQTLRHAVAWSYDLLDDEERGALVRCAVFAGGFDLAAAAQLIGSADEYACLDLLESLVRKSLVTTEQVAGRTRYGTLETIRQFAVEQLGSGGAVTALCDRHAQHFASEAIRHWELWDGPDQAIALDWLDAELANLRAAFRWSSSRGDVEAASAIAAHGALLGFARQRFEPVGWAEEILPAATAADARLLPRVLTAASICAWTGRPDEGIVFARAATGLEGDSRHDAFPHGWAEFWEALGHVCAGRFEQAAEIYERLAASTGLAHVMGRGGQAMVLPWLGRSDDAKALVSDALASARAAANPFFMAFSMFASGLPHARDDPARTLAAFAEASTYARQHRLLYWEQVLPREAARVEAVGGDHRRALEHYDAAITSLHASGNVTDLVVALANLAVLFERLERYEAAAVLYGSAARVSPTLPGIRPGVVDHLRSAMGDAAFEQCLAAGASMDLAESVQHARREIERAVQAVADPSDPATG